MIFIIFIPKKQECVTKAQVYIQISQFVAVSSYLPGFLGSTKMSHFANIPYIIYIPESVCHFPELFYWYFFGKVPWLVDSDLISSQC
jgi:hypothetical protein